jgi:glycosyltransferase involved in cell wall biosynthesis
VSQQLIDEYSKKKMRYFLVSEGFTGHRFSWLTFLVQQVEAKGDSLVIYTTNSGVSNANLLHGKEKMQVFEGNLREFADKSFCVKAAIKDSHDCINSRLLILDGDEWLPWLFKISSEARVIFMRPYLQSFSISSIVKFGVKKSVINYLHIRKQVQVGQLAIPFSKPRLFPSSWISDDIPEKILINSASEIKKNNTTDSNDYALIIGSISLRKNIDLAIRGLASYNKSVDNSRKLRLIVAGKIENNVLPLFSDTNEVSVEIRNEYLDFFEFYDLIRKAKVLLLLYTNRASSGVLTESILLKTKVIIARKRIWKIFVKKNRRFVRSIELSVPQISNALMELDNSDFLEIQSVEIFDDTHRASSFLVD